MIYRICNVFLEDSQILHDFELGSILRWNIFIVFYRTFSKKYKPVYILC